jgi:hypothetical protein
MGSGVLGHDLERNSGVKTRSELQQERLRDEAHQGVRCQELESGMPIHVA